MEVTVDDYGRIVIPKAIRDRLGLESGSSLELDVAASGEGDESITLRPRKQEPTLQRMSDLGLRSGAIYDALHVHCAERVSAHELRTFNGQDFRRIPAADPTQLVVL